MYDHIRLHVTRIGPLQMEIKFLFTVARGLIDRVNMNGGRALNADINAVTADRPLPRRTATTTTRQYQERSTDRIRQIRSVFILFRRFTSIPVAEEW